MGAGRKGDMFFDVEDLDSDDEEEILEEFMMEHSEQVLSLRPIFR
jgi:hypothetical protein